MSCTEVMYHQPYAPYLPYPPSTVGVGLSPFDKRYKMLEPSSSYDMSSPQPRSYPASLPSAATTPTSAHAHHSSDSKEQSEEEKNDRGNAQYLSQNCVLFTYYSGDISSVVDEHFSRALSADSQKGSMGKETSPMSQRNFPPSFWDSNYQQASCSGESGGYGESSGYPHLPLHGADPWAYHNAYQHQLAYPSTSRFQPGQYPSFLLQPSVRAPPRLPTMPGQCTVGSGRGYHDGLAGDLPLEAGYPPPHSYAGFDGAMQESTAKDLYWF